MIIKGNRQLHVQAKFTGCFFKCLQTAEEKRFAGTSGAVYTFSVVSEGLFPGKQTGIALAVKNSARPDGSKTDWAYYDFPAKAATAKAFADKACYQCHAEHASDDHVWVQFYPTLRGAKDAFEAKRVKQQ